MSSPTLYRAGVPVLTVVALVVAAVTVACWCRERVLSPLWVASTAGVVLMVYMLMPPTSRSLALTVLNVSYLLLQTAALARGWWSRIPMLRPAADGPEGGGASPAVGLTVDASPVVLGTLAVTAASMAFMRTRRRDP